MFLHRSKKWWDAAIGRAERTVAQVLLSEIPVGIVVTPTMIQNADWKGIYVALAWILTAAIGGVVSILTSYCQGIPEVEDE